MPGARAKISFRSTQFGLPLIPEGGFHFLQSSCPLGAHRNAGFEIVVLADGEFAWSVVGGATLHLAGGDASVSQPWVLHAGEMDVMQPCKLLWFLVDPGARQATRNTPFAAHDLAAMGKRLGEAGNRRVRPRPEITPLFWALHRRMVRWAAGDDAPLLVASIRLLLFELLMTVLDALEQPAPATTPPAVRAAQAYMASHLDRPLPVAEVARHVGLSVSRFHEVFRAATGQTPADALNRLRILRARDRLATTNTPVTEIALALGFSSSQYFARCFRKYTSQSPSGYRRQMR